MKGIGLVEQESRGCNDAVEGLREVPQTLRFLGEKRAKLDMYLVNIFIDFTLETERLSVWTSQGVYLLKMSHSLTGCLTNPLQDSRPQLPSASE